MDLANQLQVGIDQIRSYENKTVFPGRKRMLILSQLFGLSLEALMFTDLSSHAN